MSKIKNASEVSILRKMNSERYDQLKPKRIPFVYRGNIHTTSDSECEISTCHASLRACCIEYHNSEGDNIIISGNNHSLRKSFESILLYTPYTISSRHADVLYRLVTRGEKRVTSCQNHT